LWNLTTPLSRSVPQTTLDKYAPGPAHGLQRLTHLVLNQTAKERANSVLSLADKRLKEAGDTQSGLKVLQVEINKKSSKVEAQEKALKKREEGFIKREQIIKENEKILSQLKIEP